MTIPALGQFVSHARTTAPHRDRTVPPWAIISAGLTPILLTGGWLVAGALQPASYNPVRDTVSVMAGHAGTDRWVMTGALLLVGGCHLVTAAGLGAIRVSARVLLILAGLSSIGIAVSPEPVVGSTPQHLAWTSFGAVIITVWPAFHGQARITAATDCEPPRFGRRDRHVSRPAVLARDRDPGRQRPGHGRAADFVGADLVAVRRGGGAVASRHPGPADRNSPASHPKPSAPQVLTTEALTTGGAARPAHFSMIAGLREQIAGAGFALGWAVLSNVPARITSRGFRAAADRATRRGGPTVRQLRKNLRRVVGPACPEEELDALVGEAMRSYARYWLETFRLPKLDRGEVIARASPADLRDRASRRGGPGRPRVHPGPPAHRQLRRARGCGSSTATTSRSPPWPSACGRPGCSTASSPTGRASGWKCSR